LVGVGVLVGGGVGVGVPVGVLVGVGVGVAVGVAVGVFVGLSVGVPVGVFVGVGGGVFVGVSVGVVVGVGVFVGVGVLHSTNTVFVAVALTGRPPNPPLAMGIGSASVPSAATWSCSPTVPPGVQRAPTTSSTVQEVKSFPVPVLPSLAPRKKLPSMSKSAVQSKIFIAGPLPGFPLDMNGTIF
jgi:hypothetical protein